MQDIRKKMNKDLLSFSRINGWHCAYEWKLHYMDGIEGESGFFAEVGSAMHKTLEAYLKQEKDMFTLLEFFEENWKKYVKHEAPPNKYVDIEEQYHQQCIDYINQLTFDFEKFEILGVEKEVKFNIGNYKFHGFIDLLLRDKETGEIIISDHKSFMPKFKTNGEISKTQIEHFQEFKHQLYIYSIPIIEEYGKVDRLRWNFFRGQQEYSIPWNKEEYEETIQWALDRIEEISSEVLWLPNNKNQFYCYYFCSMRNKACEFKQREL